jgi:hypothetical protein
MIAAGADALIERNSTDGYAPGYDGKLGGLPLLVRIGAVVEKAIILRSLRLRMGFLPTHFERDVQKMPYGRGTAWHALLEPPIIDGCKLVIVEHDLQPGFTRQPAHAHSLVTFGDNDAIYSFPAKTHIVGKGSLADRIPLTVFDGFQKHPKWRRLLF